MSQPMMDKFEKYLGNQGLRLTGQREIIASTFFSSQDHISTEELHHQVQEKARGIGYATVYRTIKLLSDAGLAAGRSFGDGFARYEPATQTEHHDHLICTKCGKIIEFENDRIEALQETVARDHGFQVTKHVLDLYGLCNKCKINKG